MSKIKIAIVVSHPIQHFCPQYSSFSKNKNIELHVFFASNLGLKKYVDPNFKQTISWDNLQLEHFSHTFLNGEKKILPDKNIDSDSLEIFLSEFNPDTIIIYGYYQKLQRRAHKWAIRNSIPIAYISDSEIKRERNFLKDYIKSFYLKWYFSKISFFLTVGNSNKEFYKLHGVDKGKMIEMHFPIDKDLYHESYKNKTYLKNKIRSELGFKENDFIIITVGKLVSWKCQNHIISAINKIESNGLVCHLLIVGSGDQYEKWNEYSKVLKNCKVHFTGFIKNIDLPSYYATADLYVHAAFIEPHSIAISEAIYMGCPVVISSRCGSYGAEDDVQENKNGFVYQFGNIDELAYKISLLIRDEKLKIKFSNYSNNIAVTFQNKSHFEVIENLLINYNNKNKI